MSEANVGREVQNKRWVFSCFKYEVLLFGWGALFSSLGERDARPCVTRMRSVCFERCPASALKRVGPGPLGDASGSISLVVASVNVVSVDVVRCVRLTLCVAVVKYITGCLRDVCECVS